MKDIRQKRWTWCTPGMILLMIMSGCATGPRRSSGSDVSQKETVAEIETAVESVANAITQKNISEKYCPVCGKHFNGHLEKCSSCGALLKEVEP